MYTGGFLRKINRFTLRLRSLLFLGEEDNGDHEGEDCGGEEVNAKLTDKVGYEGLACLRLPNKGNALVGYEMEEEIVDYEYYR